jgi:hypothetical protein
VKHARLTLRTIRWRGENPRLETGTALAQFFYRIGPEDHEGGRQRVGDGRHRNRQPVSGPALLRSRRRKPRRKPPAHWFARARVDNVIVLADSRGRKRRLTDGEVGQHP